MRCEARASALFEEIGDVSHLDDLTRRARDAFELARDHVVLLAVVEDDLIAGILKMASDFDPDLSDPAADEFGIARWTAGQARSRCSSPLRFSSRHWMRLITRMNSGKKAMRMKPKFVTTLSVVSPYQPA